MGPGTRAVHRATPDEADPERLRPDPRGDGPDRSRQTGWGAVTHYRQGEITMTREKAVRKSPTWLQPLWERKRAETVRRVTAAVRRLEKQGRAVTLAGIREAIRELDG